MIFFLTQPATEQLLTLVAKLISPLSILLLGAVKLTGILATADVAKRDYFQYNQ